jgi:hypothetical protein
LYGPKSLNVLPDPDALVGLLGKAENALYRLMTMAESRRIAQPKTAPAADKREGQSGSEIKLTFVENAMRIFIQDPSRFRSKRALAKHLGGDPAQLSRSKMFCRLWNSCNGTLPKGSKCGGHLEAEQEEEG